MASNLEQTPIYEKLEYNYLIKNDQKSLYILMSLLEGSNIEVGDYGKLHGKTYVFRNLRRFFHHLEDIDSIIGNLYNLIGKDIDRFEVLVSILAQKEAYNNKKAVDGLEERLISFYGPQYLLENNEIFASKTDPFYQNLLFLVKKEKLSDKEFVAYLYSAVKEYCEKRIYKKIMDLDISTDKQLRFDFQNIYTSDLTLNDSMKIYYKTINYMYKAMLDVYCEYYLIDLKREVLKRYY